MHRDIESGVTGMCFFHIVFAVIEADVTHAHKSQTVPSARWQLKQLVRSSIQAHKRVRKPLNFKSIM